MSTEHFHSQDFAALLHTLFEVEPSPGEIVPFELVSVTEANFSPKLEQFSLIFHGPMTPALQQRIYVISHEKLGKFSMFFVPLGPQDGSMAYEVIFNRIRGKGTASQPQA